MDFVSNTSFWESQSFLSGYDFLIIGSGIVGLNAAIRLQELRPELKVGVVEQGTLPNGASTKNAGFATFGSLSELIDQLDRSSEEELCKLVDMRWKGLQALRSLLGDREIDFQQHGGYELFTTADEELFERCTEQMKYFNELVQPVLNESAVFSVKDEKIVAFGFKSTQHIIQNQLEGQLDTGKMMRALLFKAQQMGVIVLNGVRVQKIHSGSGIELECEGFSINGDKAIVATNAFAKQLLPQYDVVPGRGQVIVTNVIPGLKAEGTFHYDRGYFYFRNINGRILLGGGRNLDFQSEETFEQGFTPLVQSKLEELLRELILPGVDFTIEQRWSGLMAFGKVLSPIIEEVQPGLYCAVRCNGMGVAIGSNVGRMVAEMALF